ncbi:MAG: Gfo/Idh/MocA family oxidoreductase, partial [Candidatus Bathyarchaeia archaeon]
MRVGVIGCGAIAQRAHLPTFTSLENVELYAVADINKNIAKRVAKKFKVKKYFKNYKDLLEEPSIDLVSICTPSQLHAQMIIDSAKAGKHILVEKPLALSVKEALSALRAVKENNVKLCVAQNYRYFPAIKDVKKSILEGKLGRIVSILGQANTPIPLKWTASNWLYHEGGCVDDFAPHLIDGICWLCNSQVNKVVAFGGDFIGNMNCINYVQIVMYFDNKTIATANITWLTPYILSMNINGTAGNINLDLRFNNFVIYHDFLDPLNEFKNSFKKLFSSIKASLSGELFIGALSFYKNLIGDFINAIENNGKSPISGDEVLQTVVVL